MNLTLNPDGKVSLYIMGQPIILQEAPMSQELAISSLIVKFLQKWQKNLAVSCRLG